MPTGARAKGRGTSPQSGGSGGGGGWLLPYAGLMTLIFALFVVMYALSLKDVAKFKAAAESIRKAFGGSAVAAGGAAAPSDQWPDTGLAPRVDPFARDGEPGGGDGASDACVACTTLDATSELGKMKSELDALREDLREDTANLKTATSDLNERMRTLVDRRGLVIRLSAQDFFAQGETVVREDLRPLLDRIGRVVASSKRPVRVEGYTDEHEPKPREFASHWEFSAARAAWVARYWITRFELDPRRIGVAGFGHFRPLHEEEGENGGDSRPSDWARGKNRRVEIVVER